MTSPGGRIVGRVGVRVLPNTSSFKKALERYLRRAERTLRVELPTVLNTKGLDADLKALRERISRSRPAQVPVEVAAGFERKLRDQVDAAAKRTKAGVELNPLDAAFKRQVEAAIGEITKKAAEIPLTAQGERFRQQVATQIQQIQDTVKLQVPLDPAGAANFRRQLAEQVRAASAGVSAQIRVDVDRGFANRLHNALRSVIGLGSRASSTFGALSGALSNTDGWFRRGITSLGGFRGMLGNVVVGVAGLVSQLFAMAIKAPVAAAGITLIGGAALTALGSITAVAAAVPALLTGFLAPVGAVMLGFDGITRAAEKLKKPVEDMRKALSTTFENTFRPIFDSMVPLISSVNTGLHGVVTSLSYFTKALTGLFTSEAGLRKVEDALAGVGLMIDRLRPGAVSLFNAFLNIASTHELYRILGDTIGGITERLGNLFNQLNMSGLLVPAMTQVKDILLSLVDLIVLLAEGSVMFLTAAGPGITQFFKDLGGLLANIDWKGLGESFGGLMERIGAALLAIPPEKWRDIATAVGELAQKFIDWVASGGISDLITGLSALTSILLDIGGVVLGVIQGIETLNGYLESVQDFFYRYFTKPTIDAVKWLMDFLGISSPARLFIDIGRNIVDGFLNGLTGSVGHVLRFFRDLPGRMLDALGDVGRQLFDVGVDAVMGFIRGMGSKLADLGREAARLAKAAYDAAKNALLSRSPSRRFAELGRFSIDGFIVGLRERLAPLLAQVRSVFAAAMAAAGAAWDPESVLAAAGPQLNTGVHALLVDAARASQRTLHGGGDPDAPGDAQSTADELTQAFLAALQQVAVSGDQIAILADRARVQLVRR